MCIRSAYGRHYNIPLEDCMAHYVDPETCTFCQTCIDVCPVTAISEVSSKAWIDPDICIDCSACAENCPVDAISPQD